MIHLHILLVGMAAVLGGCYAVTAPEPELAVSRLIPLLKDTDPDVRRTAALSLGKIAHPEAAPDLMLALRDADPLVRQYSAWGLGNLGERARADVIAALIVVLEDPVPAVARASADAIGSLGAGPEAITRLSTILREGSVQARRSAVTALGLLESPLAHDGLLGALEDHDAGVRQEAIAALGELGDGRAVSAIEAHLRHDASAGVRTEAAYRLGTLSDERSLPILRSVAIEDLNEDVRRWARRAIEALSAPVGPGSTT